MQYQLDKTNNVTWLNFSRNVLANCHWNCSSISASKVHWRLQSTAARQSGRCMGLCAHCMCRSKMPVREILFMSVSECTVATKLYNYIWIPGDTTTGDRCTKLFRKFHPKRKIVSELRAALRKIWAIFPVERGWKSTRMLMEDIFWAFIWTGQKPKVFKIKVFVLS